MSKIEWTEHTWNVITGCTKVSTGCAHCYAEGVANRFWGDRPFSGVQFHSDRLSIPLKRKKPTTYFVNSMSDLFHEKVTDDQLDQIFAVMALTPHHTYQILTKRPERMLKYFEWCERRHNSAGKPISFCRVDAIEEATAQWSHCWEIKKFPLPNVWLGVSVENQKAAGDRIPLLLQTPAAVRFLSCEPLLEEVDIKSPIVKSAAHCGTGLFKITDRSYLSSPIDWVIAGGESGSNARKCELDWLRSLRDQCQDANIALFVKQLGSNAVDGSKINTFGDRPFKTKDRKGGDISEFPVDLQIRQYPRGEK